MAYMIGGLAGIVWLWFWIRGNWFAALLAALALGWVPLFDHDAKDWALWLVCLVAPWAPILAIPAMRRLLRDFRAIAGKDEDFSDPLSLEIRTRR